MKENSQDKPEVYALKKGEGGWQFDRRDFLKAASAGAAAVGLGLNAGLNMKPAYAEADMEALCQENRSHNTYIKQLEISKDGQYLVSVDINNIVKVWSFPAGKLLKSKTMANDVTTLAISPSVEYIYLSMSDYTNTFSLKKLRIQDLAEVDTTSYPLNPVCLKFMKDNSLLAYFRDSVSNFLSIISGKNREADQVSTGKPDHEPNNMLLFDNDSKVLVNGPLDELGLYDLVEKKQIQSFEQYQNIDAFALMPGETQALLGNSDGDLTLLSLIDYEPVWSTKFEEGISSIAVTPDGSMCFVLTEKHVMFLSTENGNSLLEVKAGSDYSNCLCVSRDGTVLAGVDEYSIRFWSLPDGKLIGCPFDLDTMTKDQKGIEVTHNNPVTGKSETITLPCGADIPDGAVCVCNCVAGTQCSCVGHCSCVGNVCSCVGHTTTYTSHYWHPN